MVVRKGEGISRDRGLLKRIEEGGEAHTIECKNDENENSVGPTVGECRETDFET